MTWHKVGTLPHRRDGGPALQNSGVRGMMAENSTSEERELNLREANAALTQALDTSKLAIAMQLAELSEAEKQA